MTIQRKFLHFHNTIQLTDADENATLREKRDLILDRLRGGLRARGLPTFTTFNQGSYATGTGVQPVNGDFDIDVGVVFSGARPDNPLEVKRWVYEAVEGHTTRVDWRKPCITVWYQSRGELIYHVDLAVYWQDSSGRLFLAMGKQHSGVGQRDWQHADPKTLVTLVKDHLDGEDRRQFRRVVRYLKRWRDVQFPVQGNAAPVGIGLTVQAMQHFRPVGNRWGNSPGLYNDLAALHGVVEAMVRSFRRTWGPDGWVERLVARVPVGPNDDVFARMTERQMLEFKRRLAVLADQLGTVARYDDSGHLLAAFGDDFPVE